MPLLRKSKARANVTDNSSVSKSGSFQIKIFHLAMSHFHFLSDIPLSLSLGVCHGFGGIWLISKNESGRRELKPFLCLEIRTTTNKYTLRKTFLTLNLFFFFYSLLSNWENKILAFYYGHNFKSLELTLGNYLQITIIIKVILLSQYSMNQQQRTQSLHRIVRPMELDLISGWVELKVFS